MNIQERFRNGNEDDTYIYISGISHGVYSCFPGKTNKIRPSDLYTFHLLSKGVRDGGPDDLDWDPPPRLTSARELSEQSKATGCLVRPGLSTNTPQTQGFTTNVSHILTSCSAQILFLKVYAHSHPPQ